MGRTQHIMPKGLFSTEYPLYAITTTPSGYVLVAGGGGSSRTGVPNAIELYTLVNGHARLLCRFTDITGAVMNIAVHPREEVAAAGIDGTMRLFSLSSEELNKTGGASRKQSRSTVIEQAIPRISAAGSQFTDFSNEGGFQKVVRFSGDGSRIATGGADGTVRLWTFPSMRQQCVMMEEKAEIDDLDFDPLGARLVSVASTPHAIIWRTLDGRKEGSLSWFVNKSLDDSPYLFKRCRFSSLNGTVRLFTILIPRPGEKRSSYIVSWDTLNWQELKRASINQAMPTALATSVDGRYVAVGDSEGFVTIFSTIDLSVICKEQAHGLFVTDLVFVGDTRNGTIPSVLSVSADRYCVLTKAIRKSNSWDLILLFVITFAVLMAVMLWHQFAATAPIKPAHTEV